ncbi:dual oxidase [Aureococcus anophagefferens]|uniref:Dual oxidase n=1 Tax=Aureococcus anophagefferens TaxID=44056 RepID=A0ABR1FVR8_AURAN
MSRLFIRARAPKSKEKPRSTSRLITRAVPAVSIAVTLYLWVRTFSPAPVGLLHWNGGEPYICPRVTVCAEDWVALGLLGATRTLAYLCYPLLMLLFLGKANNLVCALSRSVVGVYVPFHRLHELHTSAGVVAGAAFVAHGAGHAARWARQGNARLLWASQTGRTGAVAALLTPLIVVPMRSAACRAALRWELRKALHYLAVLWGLLAALHAPKSVSLPCVGIPLAVYAGDWLYGLLFRTYLVRTSRFTRLARAVQLDFENPPGFYAGGWKSGYVLVCVPWLAKAEWHAFSVFQHPTMPDHSSVCMAVGGDWTRALHDAVSLRPTTRPVWVAGPRHSPYASSFKADNIITVASGIGITPALSVLASQDESRRVNLIWICRDPSLVEFHLEATRFPANGWTLAIGEVVGGIELGLGLPEAMLEEAEVTKARSAVARAPGAAAAPEPPGAELERALYATCPAVAPEPGDGDALDAAGLDELAHWLAAPTPLDAFSPSSERGAFLPSSGALEDLVDPERLRTWLILYCGGAQPVVDALTRVSAKTGIKLKVEKFDW